MKNKLLKIFATVFLCCLVAFGFAACGEGNDGKGGKDEIDGVDGIEIPLSYEKIAGKEEYRVVGLGTVSDFDIVIPDTYNGLPVTAIGEGAFEICNITSVIIPDSVTSIGGFAFSGCGKLTNVTIPDSVTSIGWGAFSGCGKLTNVTIPDSVASIGNEAFIDCNSLTSISVNTNNEVYQSIDGNLYTKDGKTLIQYAIGKTATSFTVPNGVTSIGDEAFLGCESLTSVVIPDSVTSIGEAAFYGCSSLTSITIPDSVASIGSYAFSNCSNLTSVVIPDSVTSIGERAFYYCSNLTSVVIPDSVTSIGEDAFYLCYSLTIYCEAEGEPSGWDSTWNVSNCPVYWYSEKEPTVAGNYWHYGENGEIVV